MKTLKRIHCFLALGFALVFPPANVVFAQTPPVLGVQLCAGVNITGTTGSVYAIQSNADLSNSNGWTCAALVQLASTNYFWADPSKSAATGQRFYRAVLTSTNLAYISPGTFTMGSPGDEALRNSDEILHVVTISKGFYMGKFHVTQVEYSAVTGTNPSSFKVGASGIQPVETVDWFDATNYCALRTAQEQAAGLIPTNWAYRLPTESEWEYARRAGTTTAFYFGTGLYSMQAVFDGQVEYDVNGQISYPGGVAFSSTFVGGYFPPNDWGLYDMIGNVWDWCQDWYAAYPVPSLNVHLTDPQGPATGTNKVFRGGSWLDSGQNCRAATRANYLPTLKINSVGFRVVLAPTP